MTTRRHSVAVNLRLDVDRLSGVGLQPGNIDLNVEVANASRGLILVADDKMLYTLANNSVLRHGQKVLGSDDITVTGGSNKDI